MEEWVGNERRRGKEGKAREKKEEGREMGSGREENRKGRGREKGRMQGLEMGKVGRQNWSEEKLFFFPNVGKNIMTSLSYFSLPFFS